jgi:hypothetical protein
MNELPEKITVKLLVDLSGLRATDIPAWWRWVLPKPVDGWMPCHEAITGLFKWLQRDPAEYLRERLALLKTKRRREELKLGLECGQLAYVRRLQELCDSIASGAEFEIWSSKLPKAKAEELVGKLKIDLEELLKGDAELRVEP